MVFPLHLCWLNSMTKSVIISLIYFHVFVGFNFNGFSTKLVKIAQLSTSKRLCEKHIWKFKSQDISKVSFDLANLGDDSRDTLTTNYKCDSYSLHLYYIYPHYPQNCKETI